MNEQAMLSLLASELRDELVSNLLPFWMDSARDDKYGGYIGRIDQETGPDENAPKGSVLNARIVWTFSRSYQILGDEKLLAAAKRAYDYFNLHFWDLDHGGVYWSVDHLGRALNTRKQTYAQAFAVFGLAEYHRATGDNNALEKAIDLFRIIEDRCYDSSNGGYWEAFDRTWTPLADMRLSDKDVNAPKNVNTHLHVLEAYATLYSIWPDSLLKERLTQLVEMFLGTPFADVSAGHLIPFFDTDWSVVSNFISYGHDIEASWLVLEAAQIIGSDDLIQRAEVCAVKFASITLQEGLDKDGGVCYESSTDGQQDRDRHWWVQAEAIVGFLNAYQVSARSEFLTAAILSWQYSKKYLVDRKTGGWLARISASGEVYQSEDKVGMWKCPYHNVRACLEVISRTPIFRTSDPVVANVKR